MKARIVRVFCLCASAALIAASGARVSAQSASPLPDMIGQLKSAAAAGGDTTLQSLLYNRGGESLAAFQKLLQAKLTPEQTKLAKDVGRLGSAYLVQKNLGSLEGSQSDVAQIVSSLRKGNVTEAVPAIQKVSQSAKFTPAQKDLLTSLADKYGPGASKVSGTLKGLKGVPGLDK